MKEDFKLLDHQIQSNPEWNAWAKIVGSYTVAENEKFGCEHGMQHWNNVANIAANFTALNGGSEQDIMLAKVAGLLHDCGMICGDENHAKNGARIAKPFLQCYCQTLTSEQIDIICRAIHKHSGSKDIQNIIEAALMFADKIDLGKHRILGQPHNMIQVCETQIQKITFEVTKDEVALYYLTDPEFSFKELRACWHKAYTVPKNVCDWLGKNLIVNVNGNAI